MADLQVRDVVDGPDRVRRRSTVAGDELGDDHRHLPVHAGHADSVTAGATDRARHVRSVRVARGVVDRSVVGREVPAVGIVDESVAVVVDSVDRIVWIHPDIGRQIRMGDLHAGIDDADVNRSGACVSGIPGVFRMNPVGVRRAGGTDVRRRIAAFHSPQDAAGVVRVVGNTG